MELAVDKTFAILVDNGFNFEFHSNMVAPNFKQARSRFLAEHEGAWYAHPDRIRARDDSQRFDAVAVLPK